MVITPIELGSMSSPIYPKQPGFLEPLAQLHSTTWPLRQSATNCWITVCTLSGTVVHALMVTPCYAISSTKLGCASSLFFLIFLSPKIILNKKCLKIVFKKMNYVSAIASSSEKIISTWVRLTLHTFLQL